jgi:hypothetical protein
MRKREIVIAALAASLLTAGNASASVSCLDTCANTLGTTIFSSSGGTVYAYTLTACTQHVGGRID